MLSHFGLQISPNSWSSEPALEIFRGPGKQEGSEASVELGLGALAAKLCEWVPGMESAGTLESHLYSCIVTSVSYHILSFYGDCIWPENEDGIWLTSHALPLFTVYASVVRCTYTSTTDSNTQRPTNMICIDFPYPLAQSLTGEDGELPGAIAALLRPAAVEEYEKTLNAVFLAGAEVSIAYTCIFLNFCSVLTVK